jgi:hypothetical protein
VFSHSEDVDDAHELAADEAYAGPGVYAIDMNGLVAGPFDDHDECDWWLSKCLRIA